jgi:DNA-directed RNA polymerase subunit RPC12/RpoP
VEFKFECPTCGQHLSATQSQIGTRAPCPNCNATVIVPNESNLPPPVQRFSPQPQQPSVNPLCHTCGQGALIKRKKFRLSGPVVAIGFILLIPSALGVLFGVLMLSVTHSANKSTSASGERRIRAQLVAQNVPEPIIREVVSGKSVSDDQLVPLTDQQQATVRETEAARLGQKIGGGAATAVLGGFSMFVIVASCIGGLLGWLLIMRKRVLQCARCGAIVPAS